MKKVLQLIKFSFLAVVLFVAEPVFATVGGPTYVYDFKYNPQDESVYFTELEESGRGCPPELKKISLNTGKTETVYSCDEGEKLLSEKNNFDHGVVEQKIRGMTAGFKDLSQINLRANKITVDIDFLRADYFEDSPDFLLAREFSATIFQNGKRVLQQDIKGCALDQTFTFAGYAIPGFEKKILMVVSAVGDCFEGGYIEEKPLVVGGLDDLDKSYTTNYRKDASALLVSEATLVVTEGDAPTREDISEGNSGSENESSNESEDEEGEKDQETEESSKREYPPLLILSVVAVAALLLGFVLRSFISKK